MDYALLHGEPGDVARVSFLSAMRMKCRSRRSYSKLRDTHGTTPLPQRLMPVLH